MAHGAIETLTETISDLSLKDSAKSDSTGGGRLIDSSTRSDGTTPQSSMDCSKSDDTATKPSFPRLHCFEEKSEGKTETGSVKTTSVDGKTQFNVVALLHAGETLRYFVGFHWL